MDTLQLKPFFSSSKLSNQTLSSSFRQLRSVSFPRLNGRLKATSSVKFGGSGGAGGGSGSNTHEASSSAVEHDKDDPKGLLLGPKTDVSGSVIGFNLIPPPGSLSRTLYV